jgi:hypothetical protein
MSRERIRSVIEDSTMSQLWRDWYRQFQPSVEELEALVIWAKKEAARKHP